MFYLVKAALPHLHPDARIINTSSITAYRGSPGYSIIPQPKARSSPLRARYRSN